MIVSPISNLNKQLLESFKCNTWTLRSTFHTLSLATASLTLCNDANILSVQTTDDQGFDLLEDFILRCSHVKHPVVLEVSFHVVVAILHCQLAVISVGVQPVREWFGVGVPLAFAWQQLTHTHADPDVTS